jgi:hypothetical protein
MANPFAITAASNSVPLRDDRSGQAVFTVFNASGRPIRGRARVVAEDPNAEQWLSLVGDAERAFGIAGTEQFVVQIEAPATAPAGAMRFRLDMVDVENPDENYSRGPTVTFQVPEAPAPSKPFPWWIVAVVAGIIVLIGVAFVVSGNIRNRVSDVQATQTAVAQTQTAAAITPTQTPTPGRVITLRPFTPGPIVPITPGPIVPVPPRGTIAP